MLSRPMRRFALPALLVALAAVGCDGSADPSALSAPAASEARNTKTTESSSELLRVAPSTSETVSAVIDRKGGELKVDGHMITVPRGAVVEPTLFTMTVEGDGYLSVDLTATREDAKGNVVEVGHLGFAKPVTLKMNYAAVETLSSPDRLKIIWLVDGTPSGQRVAQKTIVDQSSKWLIAHLRHFSKYAIGT